MKDIRQGGCLCGSARFEIDLSGHETGNCHCRDCQKNTGAAFVTSTFVARNQFRWISKPLGEYSASPAAIRRFCAQCGTPLQWDGLKLEDMVDINTATLDDTSNIEVTYEIFTRSRMESIPALPGVPQYEASSSE